MYHFQSNLQELPSRSKLKAQNTVAKRTFVINIMKTHHFCNRGLQKIGTNFLD